MEMLKKFALAMVVCGLASFASAADTMGDQSAMQELSPATSGSHSTEGTDRGGDPGGGDSDTGQIELLEWLLGLTDR